MLLIDNNHFVVYYSPLESTFAGPECRGVMDERSVEWGESESMPENRHNLLVRVDTLTQDTVYSLAHITQWKHIIAQVARYTQMNSFYLMFICCFPTQQQHTSYCHIKYFISFPHISRNFVVTWLRWIPCLHVYVFSMLRILYGEDVQGKNVRYADGVGL